MHSLIRTPIVALAACALLLAGCGGSAADNTTPDGAIKAATTAFQNNDVKAMVYSVLPADKLAEAKEGWANKPPMSDQEKAQFNMTVQMLTGDGAEDNVFAMIQPQLAGAQKQVQMGVGFLGMMAAGQMQNADMSDEEKAKQAKFMAALQTWGASIDLTDEAKVKKAIAIACKVARDSGIKNAEGLGALSFDEVLVKAGPALGGLKEIVALYGLDLNGICSSMQVDAPTVEGDVATVPVTYTILGEPVSVPTKLKQVDGKWFGEQILEQ